jgi:hypothetical protein
MDPDGGEFVMRAMRAFAVLCAAGLVAGCGGVSAADEERTSELSHHGISISVPEEWDGRVLFTDAAGEGAVIFQLANFLLPPNEGLEPPRELLPGKHDPIKAMAGDDLLIMVSTGQGPASNRRLPVRITKASFLAPTSPLIPHGHAIAQEDGCFEERCLRVTVDFATTPSSEQIESANEVLSSLVIGRGG